MSLRGKIAVVTGASRGIGRGIALQLGEAGAKVYVTGRDPKNKKVDPTLPSLEKTAREITQRGGQGVLVYVDHSDMTEVKTLFEKIDRENNGQLDILVNNAYAAVDSPEMKIRKFWEADPYLWDTINNVGLRNHYFCSVYAARLMVKNKNRNRLIVNISSIGGGTYLFGVAYGVGKGGCDRMAADMGRELKSSGVTVVSLWPGAVKTELMSRFAEKGLLSTDGIGGEDIKTMFKEAESPEYSGKAVVALATDPNSIKKTGQVLLTSDLGKEYGFKDIDGREIRIDINQWKTKPKI
uniref:Dehydrogenase/reductase SDR family member 1 n=1 Tax=Acrobeloides nanus TaxID=290746 RepID=A0A914DNJ5_9BILA